MVIRSILKCTKLKVTVISLRFRTIIPKYLSCSAILFLTWMPDDMLGLEDHLSDRLFLTLWMCE
jgi:hypothetical protein